MITVLITDGRSFRQTISYKERNIHHIIAINKKKKYWWASGSIVSISNSYVASFTSLRVHATCLQGGQQYLASLLQLSSKNTRLWFFSTLMTGKNNGFIVCCTVKLWCDGCSTRCHHWGQEIRHLRLLRGVAELYDCLILSHEQDFFSPPTLYFLRTSNKIIQGKLMNEVNVQIYKTLLTPSLFEIFCLNI